MIRWMLAALLAVALTASCAAPPAPTVTPDVAERSGPPSNDVAARRRTPTVTRTPTKVPATATATGTPTPIPTSTATGIPTALPTATLAPTAIPVAGQPCPTWVHDGYKTTGPDGNPYPTWHPQIDPTYGCLFAHEHGDDPRTSLANPSMPAFGYYGQLNGFTEPHSGFKVSVLNQGDKNDEGSIALDSSRVVFHMGTGGAGRFDARFHSIEIDAVGDPKRVGALVSPVHTGGMSDTGGVGSICSDPRQGKTVMVTYGCETQSPYEIWGVVLADSLNSLNFSIASFDPGTMMNPDLHSAFMPTGERGCRREVYFGPYFQYGTDFGPATGGLGYIATYFGGDPLLPMTQFKISKDYCAPGLGPNN